MKQGPKQCRGFTLIELMITMTIAAALLVVAIPNMSAYKRNAELTSATNTLLGAINTARGEAMKRGMYAMVVPTNTNSWDTGWVVFVDKNRTQTFDGSADQTVMAQAALPSYFSVTGTGTANIAVPYIMFDGSGYSKTKAGGFGALTLTLTRNDIFGTQLNEQTRRIIIASTGRARACKPSTDTSCTTSATN